jgi:hypothetical protein
VNVGTSVEITNDVGNPIPISLPLPLESIYNQSGVIAINTILLNVDCLNFNSVSVQCISMGTTGVVTPEWSNDNTNWVAATMFNQINASATTFNGVVILNSVVYGRYFRLRLSTATTTGTTNIVVYRNAKDFSASLATQPISGTVTATVANATIAAGVNAIGDVGVQYRANATGAASRNSLISAASTNATIVKNAAGRLLGYQISNTNAAWRYVKLHNQATTPTAGAGVVQTIAVGPNSTVEFNLEGGIAFTTGIGMTTTTGSALTDSTGVGLGDLIINIFFA